jgi:hypothetical protein
MKHGKKSKNMMAGGRAGVKKMVAGGRAGYKKNQALTPAQKRIREMSERRRQRLVPPKIKDKKEKMYDVEVDGKMYKFGFDSKPTSAALKKAAKALGPKKRKSVKEVAKEINAQKKKMGGRAGVVKMMNGGDPLSKRGVKMGMSMSPSKNKGKGLYGK